MGPEAGPGSVCRWLISYANFLSTKPEPLELKNGTPVSSVTAGDNSLTAGRSSRPSAEEMVTARGASPRHVAVGCSLEQSVIDNLGDSHRVPAIARSKMTTSGSGCRHWHARDGLRVQPPARTRPPGRRLPKESIWR